MGATEMNATGRDRNAHLLRVRHVSRLIVRLRRKVPDGRRPRPSDFRDELAFRRAEAITAGPVS